MKRLTVLLATIACCMFFYIDAKVIRNYTTSTDPVQAIVVDSIDFRPDLIRVYASLLGAPHTSGRIDDITLMVGKRAAKATDIDGIDFNRYYQWEDDGIIPIEIDFPNMPQFKYAQIVLNTVRGESISNIKVK